MFASFSGELDGAIAFIVGLAVAATVLASLVGAALGARRSAFLRGVKGCFLGLISGILSTALIGWGLLSQGGYMLVWIAPLLGAYVAYQIARSVAAPRS